MTALSMAELVRERAAATPSAIALRHKRLGVWHEISWASYWEAVETLGHALLALGIEPGDRVVIQAENRPEWLYLDLATVSVRGVTVGIRPAEPVPVVGHLLAHSGATITFVEDQEQLDKTLDVAADCPGLQQIVHMESRGIQGRYEDGRLVSWDQLWAIGVRHRADHPAALDERMAQARPGDVVALFYAPGPAEQWRGAMLTAANVGFAIDVLAGGGIHEPPPGEDDVVLSVHSLCDAAERLFATWCPLAVGSQTHFLGSGETVAASLREVQPTLVSGTPRFWEGLASDVESRLGSTSGLKRRYARFWVARAHEVGRTLARNGGTHTRRSRAMFLLGWVMFFRAFRARAGLRHLVHANSTGAHVDSKVLSLFLGVGIVVHEYYGVVESTMIATANRRGRIKWGTRGEAHRGVELDIAGDTGEIRLRHPGVFAGYWRDPVSTASAVDDGWLHTGHAAAWVDGTHLSLIEPADTSRL